MTSQPSPDALPSTQNRSLAATPTGEKLRALMRLANAQLSPRLMKTLLERFQGDAEALFAAADSVFEEIPGFQARHLTRLRDPSYLVTDRQMAWVEKNDVRLVLWEDEEYPRLLHELADAPPLLFVRGTMLESDRFGVGIVGSRHATPYGRATAERMARELAGHGLTILSGGAVGIDTAAHRGALAGGGRTLAFLGCGLDVDYPRENRALFEQIVANGALVSEYPLGAQPESWHFPLRNRLISGAGMGVLVVEAPKHSGALITATYAVEQGRLVLAIPGNIDRPASEGCNALLKDGALLVTEVEDILRGLNIVAIPAKRSHQQAFDLGEEEAASDDGEAEPKQAAATSKSRKDGSEAARAGKSEAAESVVMQRLPEAQRKLLTCLSLTPRHLDAVAQEAGISAMQAGVEMTLLELNGLVRRLPGNTYIRTL